jgi:hypothetical protein
MQPKEGERERSRKSGGKREEEREKAKEILALAPQLKTTE